MKKSKYNLFLDYKYDKNKLIAYNFRSNALALIERNNYNKFLNYIEKGIKIDDNDLINNLKNGYFLINKEIDELDILRLEMQRNRFNSNSLGLTIAPTSDCNFRCIYCYEKDVIKQSYMSDETKNNIVKIVESYAKNISDLSITWYGGEPLLALDIIEYLSENIMDICSKNNIKYSAGMITNGYFLTKDNIDKLNKHKITFLQITLDGDMETHNKRRPLLGGKGTFNQIINNIEENYEFLPYTSLRINVDKQNVSAGYEIYNLLKAKKLLQKVSPYLGQVTADGGCYSVDQCFETPEFAKMDFDYHLNVYSDNLMPKYPQTKRNYCGADCLNSFVINANGDLFKCWNEIGQQDRCFGNLNDSKKNYTLGQKQYMNYLLFDPTKDKTCAECVFLPICMGGCPNRRAMKIDDICISYKYFMNNFLEACTYQLKQKKSKT